MLERDNAKGLCRLHKWFFLTPLRSQHGKQVEMFASESEWNCTMWVELKVRKRWCALLSDEWDKSRGRLKTISFRSEEISSALFLILAQSSIYDSILFRSTHLCSRYLLFILSQVLFLRFFALENVSENNNKFLSSPKTPSCSIYRCQPRPWHVVAVNPEPQS